MRRAVLVERYTLFLDAVDAVVRATGVDVVGKTTSAADALALIAETSPDLLVAGLGPDDEGELFGLLQAVAPSTVKTIVISHDRETRHVDAVFALGASAYVAYGASLEDVAAAIRQSFDPSIHLARHPAEPDTSNGNGKRGSAGLSGRELEILRLVAEGRPNGEVARTVRITEQTVKFHLSNIYRKLGVSNRTQASRRAQQLNLLSLDETARAGTA